MCLDGYIKSKNKCPYCGMYKNRISGKALKRNIYKCVYCGFEFLKETFNEYNIRNEKTE